MARFIIMAGSEVVLQFPQLPPNAASSTLLSLQDRNVVAEEHPTPNGVSFKRNPVSLATKALLGSQLEQHTGLFPASSQPANVGDSRCQMRQASGSETRCQLQVPREPRDVYYNHEHLVRIH